MTATQPQGAPAPRKSEIPRRIDILRNTDAELAIREAVDEVEKSGCDVRLTEAVTLLEAAREKIADFVDGVPAPLAERRGQEAEKRIEDFLTDAAGPDRGRHGSNDIHTTKGILREVARRHFVDLGVQGSEGIELEVPTAGMQTFASPSPQSNPAPPPPWDGKERRKGERGYWTCLAKGRIHAPGTTCHTAMCDGQRDRRQPQAAKPSEFTVTAGVSSQTMASGMAAKLPNFMGIAGDQSHESRALVGKEGSQPVDQDLLNYINELSIDPPGYTPAASLAPSCHKCGWPMKPSAVRGEGGKIIHDCPKCGATTVIIKSAALAQQQARERKLEEESANFKAFWLSASDDCKQLEARLREAEQQRDALLCKFTELDILLHNEPGAAMNAVREEGDQKLIGLVDAFAAKRTTDQRGLLREADSLLAKAGLPYRKDFDALKVLRQRIQQATKETK